MGTQIRLNGGWLFHKGDIKVPRPADKGPTYSQSKTVRKLIGPAAYSYYDRPDSYESGVDVRSEGWKYVNIPHDYIVDQDNDPTQNNAHGFFKYDNAWYRKHFKLEEEARGKRILLMFAGIAGHSVIYLNGCLMKHNFSSYNSFFVDISANVYFDRENVIAVYVNTRNLRAGGIRAAEFTAMFLCL